MNHYVPRGDRVRVRAGVLDDLSWFKPAVEFYASRRLDFVAPTAPVQCAENQADSAELYAAWRKTFP